jgi:signal transduction histidine kinase
MGFLQADTEQTGNFHRPPSTVWGEVRTRVLIWYAGLLTVGVVLSIPIQASLLYKVVEKRVADSQLENLESFNQILQEQTPKNSEQLRSLLNSYLFQQVPQDDEFYIALLNGQFYNSSPKALPEVLAPTSELLANWAKEFQTGQGEILIDDPEISSVLYRTRAVTATDGSRAFLILATTTAGERQEVWVAVWIGIGTSLGIWLLSLLLAWRVSGQVLHPLHHLAATAEEIGSFSDLSRRLPVQGSGELAHLAWIFNRMMARVQKAFQQEQEAHQLTQQQKQELEHLQLLKDEFLASITHDLRSPLANMQLALFMLERSPVQGKQQQYLAIAQRACQQQSQLIESLLTLKQLEAREYPLTPETLDLGPILRAMAETTATQCQAQGQQFRAHLPETLPPLTTDRRCFERALQELLTNAAKYTEGTICLEAQPQERGITITVANTGSIPEADLAHIFERFYRIPHTDRHHKGGTGLGLAIVQEMAAFLHWDIKASSQEGWVTFNLFLPWDLASPLPPLQ